MGSIVNSVFGGGGISSLVTSAISAIYPPAGIALGIANMVTQAVGGAVNDAVSQLTKQSGMPSFLQDPIRSMIESVVKELTQANDPECNEAAKEGYGKDMQDMMSQWANSIAQQAAQFIDEEGCQGGGKGKSSGESWLVALAKAMGSIAGKHAQNLQDLSKKMDQARPKAVAPRRNSWRRSPSSRPRASCSECCRTPSRMRSRRSAKA